VSQSPRAVILAAGLGSRLRPITDDKPKCMAPLAGRTLLDRQLEKLRSRGVADVSVVVGHGEAAVSDASISKIHNPRYAETNMVASLFCAEALLDGQRDLLMIYGDVVFEGRVLDALLATPGEVVVAADRQWRRYWSARMDDPLSDAETFRLDANGRVIELGKKPRDYSQIEAQYTGLVRFSAASHGRMRTLYRSLDPALSYDGRNVDNMFMTSFLQIMIDRNFDVRPAFIENGWLEIDTVSDIELYESWQSAGTLARYYDDAR
jgi:choline kinase